jgi:hypothetical protein
MEQTLRRVGSGTVIGLYFVWILAVIAWIVFRIIPGAVPDIVEWTVTAGAAVLFVIGLGRIIYRTPQYVEKIRGWLS